MSGFWRRWHGGIKSSVEFFSGRCFLAITGFLGSDSRLDRIERDMKAIEDNRGWRYLLADFSGLEVKGRGSLPTYFATITMRLAYLADRRQAKWLLVLADKEQFSVIHFFKWQGGRDFITEHIIYADDETAKERLAEFKARGKSN